MTDSDPSSPPTYDPQALLNAQPVMVAVIDPASYLIQFQNDTGMKQLGDLSGRTCYEGIGGCPAPCAFCKMPEAVGSAAMTMNEVAMPSGQHLLVQWSKAMTSDGRTHVIETITDVTAQKRLEAAAHKAEKMEALGRLAGGTAHEMNNLLTVIMGASELVPVTSLDSPHEPIRQIQNAVGRAGELIRRLMAVSHNEMTQPTAVDLSALLDRLQGPIRARGGPHIDVTVAMPEDRMPILADDQQIERMVMILVDNACEAMPQGGHLTLVARQEVLGPDAAEEHQVKPGMFIRLDVRDTGHGIDSGMLTHLFEPYFMRRGPQTGRGLGLASLYSMMRQAGGHITAASEAKRGSAFSLWFPYSEQDPVRSDGPGPTEPNGQASILLVEDDDDVRLAVSDMLRQAGYQVEEACDGMDAIRLIKGMRVAPHLILTDVLMPRMTGPQFITHIQALVPTTKVLYMSGYTNQMLTPLEDQPLAFIAKPFSSQDLLRKVQETLSH
jgi:two-component system, cell cycle sensor histidine kinase and response regulator CckA